MSHNLGTVWRQLQARLQHAGLDPAPREARLLVAHALGLQDADVILRERDLFPYEKTEFLESLALRRLAGEPLAYVLGHAPFWDRDWRVTPDVLIPRPDSEVLVRAVLAELETLSARLSLSTHLHIAEVGVGSGALIGSVLRETPTATAVGTDISAPALDIARHNLREAGVMDRCQLQETDLLANIDGPFDLIMSNPPYIAEAEWATLAPSVKDFEPRTALLAGEHGLDVYVRLIHQAAAKLRTGGLLCLEIGWQQATAVTALLNNNMPPEQKGLNPAWTDIQLLQDLAGRDRVLCARLL